MEFLPTGPAPAPSTARHVLTAYAGYAEGAPSPGPSRRAALISRPVNLHLPVTGGRIGLRMFIETIAATTIHTIEDTSNEEDPHVYNHISNPSYNQLHKHMTI